MPALPQSLLRAVQYNCDVSDAQHAGSYTLCIYLMHMREYFRWHQQLGLEAVLGAAEVGEWVDAREQQWADLREADYQELPILGHRVDPFDADTVNDWLVPRGYCYSAGVGRLGKPVFFVGELIRVENGEGYRLFQTGAELVRELMAPPAMTRGDVIWIRRESLRRVLWEMVDEWRWKKPRNAMSRVLDCYGFAGDAETALQRMTDEFTETVILHELGELVCGRWLGDDWERMLQALGPSVAEVLARAVRDHLADCVTVLPALLTQEEQAPLHFYFASMTPARKQLFPALYNAYQGWLADDNRALLKQAVRQGQGHWRAGADAILSAYRSQGADAGESIAGLAEQLAL
jgi:hypothetical protein